MSFLKILHLPEDLVHGEITYSNHDPTLPYYTTFYSDKQTRTLDTLLGMTGKALQEQQPSDYQVMRNFAERMTPSEWDLPTTVRDEFLLIVQRRGMVLGIAEEELKTALRLRARDQTPEETIQQLLAYEDRLDPRTYIEQKTIHGIPVIFPR
ncbi:MAG: hypothetical protein Q7R56_02860 [Nanoarchaeota archaeon]|nr:hypothetical protein [Nanoarchaeota archaeon]